MFPLIQVCMGRHEVLCESNSVRSIRMVVWRLNMAVRLKILHHGHISLCIRQGVHMEATAACIHPLIENMISSIVLSSEKKNPRTLTSV